MRASVPGAEMDIGLGRVVLGGCRLITQQGFPIPTIGGDWGTGGKSYVSIFLFGLAYALATLSCTFPIFLAVMGNALTLGGGLTVSAVHTGSSVTTADANAAGGDAGEGVAIALTVSADSAIADVDRDVTSAIGNGLIEAKVLSDSSATAIAAAMASAVAAEEHAEAG